MNDRVKDESQNRDDPLVIPPTEKPCGEHEYKLYTLRLPHVGPDEVMKAAEQKLLDDLNEMDVDGYEIAFPFPSGTHFLMKRVRPEKKDK